MDAVEVVGFEIVRHQDGALPATPTAPNEAGEIGGLMRLAVERNVPVEMLERLVALQERVTERAARAAFYDAMARFQAEVGPVPKLGKVVVGKTHDGLPDVRSRFAPLHVIADHIREPLRKAGLFYSWDSRIEGDDVDVSCTVRHVEGHSETSHFRFPSKSASAPGMNGVQIAGSARTYGERYSLIQALGLTTADPDDDGKAAEVPQEDPITEGQAADLNALMREVNADAQRFSAWLKKNVGVEKIEDVPASKLGQVTRALEEKRRKSA